MAPLMALSLHAMLLQCILLVCFTATGGAERPQVYIQVMNCTGGSDLGNRCVDIYV